jgi:nucleotide-binding universal stress UspA family protein
MALKDLLVLVDGSESVGMRLGAATNLAKQHGATLTGLHVLDISWSGGETGGVLSASELSRVADDAREQASRLADAFWEQVRRSGVDGQWRVALGPPAGAAAAHARYADMVILGQIDPEDPATQVNKGAVEQTLFSSGRPVIVLPYTRRSGTVGDTVVIGWKPSREAARALNDAIPILENARSVAVIALNPGRGLAGDSPALDAARHLARHGIAATATDRSVEPAAEPDALLDFAGELRADLLVLGGYGHLTESIMGGVTRVLLQRTTLPLLLSH